MILPQRLRKTAPRRSAFTLLEVLVVTAIIVIMAGTAVVFVPQYLEDAKVSKAKTECLAWENAVKTYYTNNQGEFPNQLSDVTKWIDGGANKMNDPWGHPYQYDSSSGSVWAQTQNHGKITKTSVERP